MKINAILHRDGVVVPNVGLTATVNKRRNGPPVKIGSTVSRYDLVPLSGTNSTAHHVTVMLPVDDGYRERALADLQLDAAEYWDCTLVHHSDDDGWDYVMDDDEAV